MKKLSLVFIIISLLSISFVVDYTVETSYYSELLSGINENNIDSALNVLPKRNSVDILEMGVQMNKEKKEFSLTDAEAAYLVYKWIGQNIEVDCSDDKIDIINAINTYKSGKSNYQGISLLFKMMCLLLDIQSDSIHGIIKKLVKNGKIVDVQEYIWNYIIIKDKTYLVDASMGPGFCEGNEFLKRYTDFFFATKPEFFIRSHLPDESKFQFLNNAINTNEFNSKAFLRHYFYLNGFKNISPDKAILGLNDNIKIVLNYIESITDMKIDVKYVTFDGWNYNYQKYEDFVYSGGHLSISLNLSKYGKNVCGFIIYAGRKSDSTIPSIVNFDVTYTGKIAKIFLNNGDVLKFKKNIRNDN